MVSSMIDTGDRDSAFSEARRFLEALAGQDQKFVFQWFADPSDCSIPPGNAYETFDTISNRLWNFNESGAGIFVTINESGGSRKADDITRVRAVFVDLDGSPVQPIRDADLTPHIIVESSPDRWHAYWLVDDDFRLDDFRRCQRALAQRFDGDKSICDLSRVMRLPGFVHRKKDPFVTRIEHMEGDLSPYSADEILGWACPNGSTTTNVVPLPTTHQAPGVTSSASHHIRYATHLLAMEAAAVRDAPDGDRNNQLNRSAYKMGSYVGAGLLSCPDVADALKASAEEAGLDDSEVEGTLQSGLDAGAQIALNMDELADQSLLFDVVQELNAKHAAVMVGGKFAVLNLADNEEQFTYSRRPDFMDRYADELMPQMMRPGQTKPPTKAQLWCQSPLRKKYSGVVFKPGEPQDVKGQFNLWRGYAIAPKTGKTTLYWELVRDAICGGDDDVYMYVRKYLAHLVQRPAELPGVSLALRSGQGTGKNTFMKPFAKILGRAHYIEITSTQHLLGNFNAHLSHKLLVFANEAMWGGDKKAEGRFKAMVTDREEGIERKFFDLTTETNYKRIIFASNNDWFVPVGLDDRRLLVLEVSTCFRGDLQFWTRLHEELENGGYGAILHDLLNEPLDAFVPTDRPMTAATERAALEQKMQRWDSTTDFWYTALQEGQVPNLYIEGDQLRRLGIGPIARPAWADESGTRELHQAYLQWCHNNGHKHADPDSVFSRKMVRELCPRIRKIRPTRDGRRIYMYVIPPLSECRKLFETVVGARIDWSSDYDEPLDEGPSASQSTDSQNTTDPSTEAKSHSHRTDTDKDKTDE